MLSRDWRYLRRAVLRVFDRCGAQSQAVTYNLFLAFFPAMLFALGVLSFSERYAVAVQEMFARLRSVLPFGSRQLVLDYLVGRVQSPGKWIGLGFGGMLLVGLQVMSGMMRGFQLLHGDTRSPGFWNRQARGLVMLFLMLGPWIGAVMFTVFGKQVRAWMIAHFGIPVFFRALWVAVYLSLALVTAALVLACIYRLGRAARQQWNQVLPGAIIATLLWWVVNTAFGAYVRRMPYSMVYGSLAAAIGLMVWMHLSVIIVFIGAAYNAISTESTASLPADSQNPADTPPPPE